MAKTRRTFTPEFKANAGYKDATKFTRERLALKLDRMDPDKPKFLEKPTGASAELLDSILAAKKKGKEVGLEEPEAKETKAPAAVKSKKGSPSSNGKVRAGADKWGYTGRKAEINALIHATKAKTLKQIRDEGSIPGSYKEYLDELKTKGLIKGDHEKGFVLSEKGAKSK